MNICLPFRFLLCALAAALLSLSVLAALSPCHDACGDEETSCEYVCLCCKLLSAPADQVLPALNVPRMALSSAQTQHSFLATTDIFRPPIG